MRNKKMVDYIIAIPAAVLAAPLMAAIAVWIKLDSPGPVFFRQRRIGIHKTQFDILKFRTMRTDTPKDTPTHLLKNPEQYITKSGAFLRKTSLDELPQLINILKGEMSVVGPRPALWNQFDLIAERDRYGANDVLPGLTGWAQIHGRDTITIREKAKLDGYYVEHQSLWLDIKCIFLTAISVLRHEGVREGGTGAMEQTLSEKAKERYPKVSVVAATYRRDRELQRALSSLAAQTYPNLEIILVDDNGDPRWNDKVREMAEKWNGRSHIPLRYIRNEENKGSAASRNIGIGAATGEYITFLDDDDKYMPGKVEHQLRHMVRLRSDVSAADLALYNENGKLEERRTRDYLTGLKCKEKHSADTGGKKRVSESYEGKPEEYRYHLQDCAADLLACHLMYHITGTDTLMFRKAYLEKIGGFPLIDVGDEFYLMKEALMGGGVFSYLPVCDVKALVHTKTDGLSSRESKIKGENILYEYKKQFFSELKQAQVRKIRMRHHLVLAYAYMRDGRYGKFLWEGAQAFVMAPVSCLEMVSKRK